MLFNDVNFRPDLLEDESGDTVACPKCQNRLVRHLVWNQEGCRIFTYHCPEHGDVVPVVKS